MSEDEVVLALATYASNRRCHVLVAAANQIAAFCFRVPGGRRKAPDLAFYCDDTLYLFEAKVVARDLFRSAAGKLSDVEGLQFLMSSPVEMEGVAKEAKRRIHANMGFMPPKVHVCCGVVASNSLRPYKIALVRAGIIGVCVDPVSRVPSFEVLVGGGSSFLLSLK